MPCISRGLGVALNLRTYVNLGLSVLGTKGRSDHGFEVSESSRS
jgi:hypothetical protein